MGEMLTLTAEDGHRLAAYKASPAGAPRGALVVVQEIFGVNTHIRRMTDGFAADGYVALAPALFDRVERDYQTGYTQADIDRGRATRGKLTIDQAVMDVCCLPGGFVARHHLHQVACLRLGAIAARHHDAPHSGFDGSMQEIIEPHQITLHGHIKGETVGSRPPLQRRMVHRPRLGREVLNRVYPLHRLPAHASHREVALDPGECGKLRGWGTPR